MLILEFGEWNRLLSAPFLHGNALHLILNGVALYYAGMALERLVGRAWFLTLFLIGAFSGSVMSLIINHSEVISVGASGAIMGLFSAAYIVSYHLPESPQRFQFQVGLMQILLPSLLPLATYSIGHHIDYAAHTGGALGGALSGSFLLITWDKNEPLPRFRRAAYCLAVLGSMAVMVSGIAVYQNYPTYVQKTQLIPSEQFPAVPSSSLTRAQELVTRYPHDPRAYFIYALARLKTNNNFLDAEHTIKTGLTEEVALRLMLPKEAKWLMQSWLALILAEEGKRGEAKTMAQAVCNISPTVSPSKSKQEKAIKKLQENLKIIRKELQKQQLCS